MNLEERLLPAPEEPDDERTEDSPLLLCPLTLGAA